jgi:hypothetical protein
MESRVATLTGPIAGNIRTCGHCGLPYDWRRSTSSYLKMTYCGSMCEKAGLGFTIEGLLRDLGPVELPAAA